MEVLKAWLDSNHSIPMAEQTLTLDDERVMIDPLSLSDYQLVQGDTTFVNVAGEPPAGK